MSLSPDIGRKMQTSSWWHCSQFGTNQYLNIDEEGGGARENADSPHQKKRQLIIYFSVVQQIKPDNRPLTLCDAVVSMVLTSSIVCLASLTPRCTFSFPKNPTPTRALWKNITNDAMYSFLNICQHYTPVFFFSHWNSSLLLIGW